MGRLILLTLTLMFFLTFISYKVGEYSEKRERRKKEEEKMSRLEFEKDIDKLANEISKRNR